MAFFFVPSDLNTFIFSDLVAYNCVFAMKSSLMSYLDYLSIDVCNLPLCVVDNASDPGVTAKQIWIDVITVKEELCLSFTDNGSGMTPSKLHKMLR